MNDINAGPRSLLLAALAALSAVASGQQAENPPAQPAAAEEVVDVDTIGEIVILGRRDRNIQQSANQVLSVLSADDIAHTGEGDIAGALSRVTGLSVASNGFVYVRGLGDRYSQALLNGLPLPSPEPLRRAVPLDLFPTDVIASSVVQKSYSPNFTGEFGGGLINLTTLAVPREPFFKFGFGISGDTETTGQLGYTHYGSKYDWTGSDSGVRDVPPAVAAYFAGGTRLSSGTIDTRQLVKQFVNTRTGLVQFNDKLPVNMSFSATGGTSRELGDGEVGLIATAGYGQSWRTKDNIEQNAADAALSVLDKDYREVATDNRVIINGLVGIGYEFGEGNKVRWTNLIIRDTLKRTSLAEGKQNSQRPGRDFIEQETGWYERQVWSTQLSGGFNLDPVKIDLRAAYANSTRKAPFELGLGYSRTNVAADPTGQYFVNRLDNGQTGYAEIVFSNLDEDLFAYGADASWEVTPKLVLSAGFEGTDTERDSERREFLVIAPSTFPSYVGMFRPDYLLGSQVVDFYGIGAIESTESQPAFTATLKTQAAYLQAQTEVVDGFEVNVGARYEQGEQRVEPKQVFNTVTGSTAGTLLDNDYVLPALTLTWKFADDMQARFNASRTIARPQFRELMLQSYYDPESNRAYRGNPLLTDSEFTNAELRWEWYFARDQRLSAAAFWKEIDKPIEAFTSFNDNDPLTSFANAPAATLYGVELESQTHFDLWDSSDAPFFASRRLVLIGNYTWSKSELSVKPGDTAEVFGSPVQPASNFFRDGAPLTGQSEHLANLQIGFEDQDSLSQQTLLISYASDRVTSRGAGGLPDIYESPGVSIDFVARQGFEFMGRDLEFKFEARNLLRRDYREYQELGPNRIYFNRYDVGVKLSASVTASF
ncbi:MAG: TonB-dependent receptor domain-containing protein [Gammaproteobacteria bacterium]